MKQKKEYLLKTKDNTAITLIALVITIIVLLILAGVTIQTLTGDNGLLTKAGEAKQSNKEAEIRERIQLAVTAAETNDLGELKRESLEEELSKEFGENNFELILVGKGYIIIVDNIQYKVEEDGTVQNGNELSEEDIENAGDLSKGGQYDGLTEETAYRISCIEDLVEWTNKANNYSGKFIKLDKTLDFQKTSDYNDYTKITTDINGNRTKEALITELTTGTGFKPISSFSGTFDGQENEIRNIYENTSTKAGLFATSSGTIKNLGITGEITSTVGGNFNGVGALVGGGTNNNPTIIGCYSKCIITSTNTSGAYKGAGGLVGQGYPTVKNCYSESTVIGNGNVGGIIGYSDDIKIYNCYNKGYVKGSNAGGLCGYGHSRCKLYIYNSYNEGCIEGESVGGLYGKTYNASMTQFINCYNIGKIIGKCAGGIQGSADMSDVPNVINCFNVGSIEIAVGSTVGSIIGSSHTFTTSKLDTSYYVNEISRIVGNSSYKGNFYSKEYMQSQEFADKLNTYVDNYNEEHKNDENYVPLKNWKYNSGDYPTYE